MFSPRASPTEGPGEGVPGLAKTRTNSCKTRTNSKKNRNFTSEKSAANSSVPLPGIFPDWLLHAENEKMACFGGRVLGPPHTGHFTRDRSDTRDGSATCDRYEGVGKEEENALIYRGVCGAPG
jgi:hypothetical protein